MEELSKSVLERIPLYLHYLKSKEVEDVVNISSAKIAHAVKLGEVQVRKDLAKISGSGRPKTGYVKDELIADLAAVINHDKELSAVVVGAGKIGKALLSYDGFEEYGISIIAAFDSDEAKLGEYEGKAILPMGGLKQFVKSKKVRIGILTVPESSAQDACDNLILSGVKAIWNFSSTGLSVPDGVVVRNENLAASLAVLSAKLKKR